MDIFPWSAVTVQYKGSFTKISFFVASPDSEEDGEDDGQETDQDTRDLFDDIYPDNEELASQLPPPQDLKKHMESSDDKSVEWSSGAVEQWSSGAEE